MINMHFIEQGSPEWHAARENNYTGSNAYKLLGSMDVLDYAKAVQQSFSGNYHTKRGHILEDEAIELYEQIYGVKILRDDAGLKVGYITNDKYRNCLYSPDGVPPIPLLEVKCFAVKQHMKLVNNDIALKIKAQIHYGLWISDRPYAELLAYNPEIENPKDAFKVIRINRDKSIDANFKRILKGVIQHEPVYKI